MKIYKWADKFVDGEIEVLRLCLTAAADSPFLRGLYYAEKDFLALIGTSREHVHCVIRYWPDLDSNELHSDYERLDENCTLLRPLQSDGNYYPYPQAHKRVYDAVEACLYFLNHQLLVPQEPIKLALGKSEWNKWIGLPQEEVYPICERWQYLYRAWKLT